MDTLFEKAVAEGRAHGQQVSVIAMASGTVSKVAIAENDVVVFDRVGRKGLA